MALRKSKKSEHPRWRPDFRDPETLPDIKPIRTDFLLNLVAVSVAIVLLGLLTYREYRAHGLRDAIAQLEQNIEDNRAVDRENVQMSREFARMQKEMNEVVRFHNVPLSPDVFLAELTAMQPDSIILESVNFRGSEESVGNRKEVRYILLLAGTVRLEDAGPAAEAITAYRGALEQLPSVAPYFISSEQPGFTRDAALKLFHFTIRLTLRETPAEPAS